MTRTESCIEIEDDLRLMKFLEDAREHGRDLPKVP